jgi:hypothetical protein
MKKLFTSFTVVAQMLLAAVLGLLARILFGPPEIKRAMTHDVAFTFRMGAGFAGTVNRLHPADIMPSLMDPTNPIRRYGDPCIAVSTGGYRGILASDQAAGTKINGVLVRSYPTQQANLNQALGDGTPPVTGIIDVLVEGNIMTKVVGAPTKRSQAFVWAAADSGAHKLGGFEAAATGGSTMALVNAYFNGPADANGVAEVKVFEAPLP